MNKISVLLFLLLLALFLVAFTFSLRHDGLESTSVRSSENSPAKNDAQIEVRPESTLIRTFPSCPDDEDESVYAEAYRLVRPNMRARAQEAIRLLTENRQLTDIPAKELGVLFTAYNEIGDADKQLEVAEALWEVAPGTHRSLDCMKYALNWKGDPRAVIDFVDRELSRESGGEHELLMMKAAALAETNAELPSSQEKKQVADLVVAAMQHDPTPDEMGVGTFMSEGSGAFLDFESPFVGFFSAEERAKLKARIDQVLAEK